MKITCTFRYLLAGLERHGAIHHIRAVGKDGLSIQEPKPGHAMLLQVPANPSILNDQSEATSAGLEAHLPPFVETSGTLTILTCCGNGLAPSKTMRPVAVAPFPRVISSVSMLPLVAVTDSVPKDRVRYCLSLRWLAD